LIYQSGIEELKEDDWKMLDKHNIRQSVTNGCPNWLIKWIALTLHYIEDEKDAVFKEKFAQKRNGKPSVENKVDPTDDEKAAQYEANSLESDRLQNLIFTVDKVKHCISLICKKYEITPPNKEESPMILNALPDVELPNKPIKESLSDQDSTKNNAGTSINSVIVTTHQLTDNQIEEETENNTEPIAINGVETMEIEKILEIDIKLEPDATDNLGNDSKQQSKGPFIVINDNRKNKQEKSNGTPMEGQEDSPASSAGMNGKKKGGKPTAKVNNGPRPCRKTNETKAKLRNAEESADNLIGPPLREIPISEVVSNLWGVPGDTIVTGDEVSIREEIIKNLVPIVNPEVAKVIEGINEKNTIIMNMKDSGVPDEVLFYEIRRAFLETSDRIRKITQGHLHYEGMADILYLYAFTFSYFTSYDYTSVSSDVILVRKCDVVHPKIYFENDKCNFEESDVIGKDTKSYSSSYIWGQLCVWWKQTVEKPEASLSQDRRGTLSYPNIDVSYAGIDADKKLGYPYGTRALWIDHLKKSPGSSWPVMKTNFHAWSFKNSFKMYGTFLVDGINMKERYPDYIDKVLDTMDSSMDKKLALFEELNKLCTKKPK
jgi:hypothetical protein